MLYWIHYSSFCQHLREAQESQYGVEAYLHILFTDRKNFIRELSPSGALFGKGLIYLVFED